MDKRQIGVDIMKKKSLIIIIPVIIALLAFVGVYRYYNKEDKTTTLTVTEKRWVENNKSQEYDYNLKKVHI